MKKILLVLIFVFVSHISFAGGLGIEVDTTTSGGADLSEGTATETTVDVDSSSGTDATLVSASTSRAGLLTKAKFDEIVANTSKVAVTDGDKGSITVSASGATWTLDDDAVTTGKILTDAVTMDSIDADGDFTSLTGNWYTTGELNGKLDVNLDTTATYAIPTQAHYGGTAVNNDADAIEMDLNAAAVGMSILIIDNAGGAITLDPNGTDTIVYEGTAGAAGAYFVSSGAKGDFISLVCLTVNQWMVIGHDANAWTEEP